MKGTIPHEPFKIVMSQSFIKKKIPEFLSHSTLWT